MQKPRRMTRRFFLVVLVVIVSAVHGQSPGATSYDNVYISYSLEDFHRLIQTGEDRFLDRSGLYLINATITAITDLSSPEMGFYVDLELMDAVWDTNGELHSFVGYAVIDDPVLAERVSTIASDNSVAKLIAPKTRGTFLMEFYSYVETPQGSLAPLFFVVEHHRL